MIWSWALCHDSFILFLSGKKSTKTIWITRDLSLSEKINRSTRSVSPQICHPTIFSSVLKFAKCLTAQLNKSIKHSTNHKSTLWKKRPMKNHAIL